MSETANTIPAVTKPRRDPLALIVRFQSVIGLLLVLVGGIVFSPVRRGHLLFLAPDNIANIVRAISETGIIALGMTFVIITAGIDLSVGAALGLASVLAASLMVNLGWGILPTLIAVILAGTAFGALQGYISTRFRLEAFIVTLAGLQVARGLALVVSGNAYINISYGDGPGFAPPAFAVLGTRLFGKTVPVATLVFLALAVVATFVLNTTRFGRYVYAVGGNERAARLSGIPVSRVRISVYALTGFMAAVAGIVHAGQFNFGSANDGAGYELTAIAAVVIGGTSLFGGAGTMIGTIAGSIMLGALANILQLNNINAALQLLATGAIIVLAAVLQAVVGRREVRADARQHAHHQQGSRTTMTAETKRYARRAALLAATMLLATGPAFAGQIAQKCGKDGKYVVAFSQANYAEPYRQHVNNDLIALAKEIPQFELQIADGAGNDNTQTSQVDNFITQQVDLLLISPFEAAPLTPAVARAMKAGIPVIELDRKTVGTAGKDYTAFVGGDNYKIAFEAGSYTAKTLMPDGGEVAVLEGLPSSTPAVERLNGFKDGVKANPKIKVVAEQAADWLPDKAETAFSAILQAHPDIGVVYASNDMMAAGSYLAAKGAGKEAQVKVIGTDGLPGPAGGIQAVASGQWAATFTYPTGAPEALDLAKKILLECASSVPDTVTVSTLAITKDNAQDLDKKLKF